MTGLGLFAFSGCFFLPDVKLKAMRFTGIRSAPPDDARNLAQRIS